MLSISAIPSKHSKSYLQLVSVHDPFIPEGRSSIPVGWDLNLELRRLLHSVNDRAVLVCGLWGLSGELHMSMGFARAYIFVELNACIISVSLCPAKCRSSPTHQIQSTTHRIPPWYTYRDAQETIRQMKYRRGHRSTYSRPSSLKRAALSTEIVGMAGDHNAIQFCGDEGGGRLAR